MTKIFDNINDIEKEAIKLAQMKAKYADMTNSLYDYKQAITVTAEANEEETKKAFEEIENGDFDINDYSNFLISLYKSSRDEFLTPYTEEELKEHFTTYKLKDFDAGFAIKDDGDITSVHNNTGIKGLGGKLIEKAKELGGTKLDHFAGYLDDFYKNLGFEEYDRWTWNDEYAPKNWKYDEYGRPDVVLRRLKKEDK